MRAVRFEHGSEHCMSTLWVGQAWSRAREYKQTWPTKHSNITWVLWLVQAWCLVPTKKTHRSVRTDGHELMALGIELFDHWFIIEHIETHAAYYHYVERTRSNSDTLCVSSAKAHISRVAHQFLASKMMLPIIVGKSKQEQSHWCNSPPKKVLVHVGTIRTEIYIYNIKDIWHIYII